MRTLAPLGFLLLLTGCGSAKTPHDIQVSYATGAIVICNDATSRTDVSPTEVICTWDCADFYASDPPQSKFVLYFLKKNQTFGLDHYTVAPGVCQ